MEELKGKKLLVLAGSWHLAELVKRAKELGVYTVVTDYYDSEDSPAKKVADEYWNISWSDTDALVSKCREENIDGITTGYSEFAVEKLIELCEKLGKPCYCTRHQLDVTRDKIKFKQECRKNNVPVIKEYSCVDEVDEFPVIVKPVDRAGSIGISIAKNRKELIDAYQYAMEMSVCKRVIIEKYISDGTKFDVFYFISNEKIEYITSCDTINAQNNGEEKVVQSAWVFPSKHNKQFKSQIDENINKMIKKLGIKNGYIFFSGFYDNGSFAFFETGFRLSGGHMYTIVKKQTGIDLQDIFIQHALIGKSNNFEDVTIDEPQFKTLMLNLYSSGGTITRLDGLEEISSLEDCGFVLPISHEGQECQTGKAILTKLAMIHLFNDSPKKLKEDADKVYSLFVAEDEFGKDMIFDRIDTNIITDWWS